MKFQNPGIKHNLVPTKTAMQIVAEDPNKNVAVNPEVQMMRANILDANIVRIMKARKVLPHNDLIQEVLKAVTMFKPEPRHIKQRIENLIEKGYMERDSNVKGKYIYKP